MNLEDYAKKFIGIPYIWGGKCPVGGLDCSGFVDMLLDMAGISPAKVINAQGIHDWLVGINAPQSGGKYALAFFGTGPQHITHITLILSPYLMIEAGGGDQTCVDRAAANAKNAFVKVSKIDHRRDLVATFMPPWPDWIE